MTRQGLLDRDAELLAACRLGDAEAWREVLRRYERLVFSIPLRYGLSREDAADVCQSTFTALLQELDTVRDGTRLGGWLGTVARRAAWRLLDRSSRDAHDPIDLDELGDDGDPIGDYEQLVWLTDGLLALDERCRDLLITLYFDESAPSYAEVAHRLGRPVGSIGPTRARCLAQLRDVLDRED